MKINVSLLYECGVSLPHYERFMQTFPNGEAEFVDILKYMGDDMSFVNFIIDNIPVLPDDLSEFNKYYQIVESLYVYDSQNVSRSRSVSHSYDVTDSNTVMESHYITNSTIVINGYTVTNSAYVINSSFIEDSNDISGSQWIEHSNYINDSQVVDNSRVIIKSSQVSNSSVVVDSDCIKDCFAVRYCKNAKQCLFCIDTDNNETPMLFNKPISQSVYNMVSKQLNACYTRSPEEWDKLVKLLPGYDEVIYARIINNVGSTIFDIF